MVVGSTQSGQMKVLRAQSETRLLPSMLSDGVFLPRLEIKRATGTRETQTEKNENERIKEVGTKEKRINIILVFSSSAFNYRERPNVTLHVWQKHLFVNFLAVSILRYLIRIIVSIQLYRR